MKLISKTIYINTYINRERERQRERPVKESRKVVLPQPEGPMTAIILAGSAKPVILLSNFLLSCAPKLAGRSTVTSSHIITIYGFCFGQFYTNTTTTLLNYSLLCCEWVLYMCTALAFYILCITRLLFYLYIVFNYF